MHIVIHWCQKSNVSWLQRERTKEALFFIFSCILSSVLLPLADSNLHPFSVINHNHRCNSFQWVLWALLENYWNSWYFREPPECAGTIRIQCGLVWTVFLLLVQFVNAKQIESYKKWAVETWKTESEEMSEQVRKFWIYPEAKERTLF